VTFGPDGFEIQVPLVSKNESLPPSYEIAVGGSAPAPGPPAYEYSAPPVTTEYSPYTDPEYRPTAGGYQPPAVNGFVAPVATPATETHYSTPLFANSATAQPAQTYGTATYAPVATYGPNAGTSRPLPHAPVVPVNGVAAEPPRPGIFNAIARSFQNIVMGNTERTRLYPQSVQTTPIAKIEEQREAYQASMTERDGCDILGDTVCELKSIIAFTIGFAIFLTLLIIAASHVDQDPGWLGLMIPSIMFTAYITIAYIVVVWCSFCIAETGRAPCGCRSPLYIPFHQAVKRVDTTVSSLYTQVNMLDDSRPGLYIRVEGYQSEADFNQAKFNHGSFIQQRRHGVSTQLNLYGFTHHFPVVITAAANTSASAVELDRWFQQYSNYSAVSFQYTYSLSPQDRQWIDFAMAELRRIYTGHEGCRFINTSIVYTLDSVTPTGSLPISPINAEGFFDRFRRPGVNSALHDWTKVADDGKPGVVPNSIQVVKHNNLCCQDICFNRCCGILSIMTYTYFPFILFYRCCLVREVQFVHKKTLRLQHELAPMVYQDNV